MSKECILPVVSFLSNGLFYKKTERSDSNLRHSIFDIRRSIFFGTDVMMKRHLDIAFQSPDTRNLTPETPLWVFADPLRPISPSSATENLSTPSG